MGPIVSILIPTRNRPDLLVKAITSALCQTYKLIEVVITDNSDTARAADIVTQIGDARVNYIKNAENIGPILNWKKALNSSNGEYCFILPDDDYLINPFYIEDAVKILSNLEIQLVVPDCVLSYSNRNAIGASGHSGQIDGKAFIRKGLHIPHIGNMFRRSVAQGLGAFHSNDILWSDIELWMRVMSIGDVYCYNKPSLVYLFHDNNIVLKMSSSELISNSRFIRSSVESFATNELIAVLVARYLCTVDSISNNIDHEFIRSVIELNGVREYEYFVLRKIGTQRIKKHIKRAFLRLIGRESLVL